MNDIDMMSELHAIDKRLVKVETDIGRIKENLQMLIEKAKMLF